MTPSASVSISRLAWAEYRTASRVKQPRTARIQSIGMVGPRLAQTLRLARPSDDRRSPARVAMPLRRPTTPESCYRKWGGNTISSSRGRPAATCYRPADCPPPTICGCTQRESLLTLPPEATPRARVERASVCLRGSPRGDLAGNADAALPPLQVRTRPPGRVHSQRRRIPPLRRVAGHPTWKRHSLGMRESTPPAAHCSLQWRTLP